MTASVGGWHPEMIKLRSRTAVFDIDGTLCFDGRTLGLTVNHHLDEGIIDYAPGATTKWEALQALEISDYAAFGNDINDLDLLRNAERSVRVGSHPSLDGAAQITVPASPEDVAGAINLLAAAARS
ncbi:HAD family hydrolase [Streptomyces sp. CB01881]|uniref:HAD family hydrolase n=1 Tax=Streptomyces sp. CB01881 TaxID=2078691 RepID=UPI001F1194AA|nr:HAD family hydrolase [Streptomyces sp. CB01881]